MVVLLDISMVKVKICGITNLEDARAAIAAGADALGFVFYKKSPRYINPKEAGQIIRQLPPVIKVGVFVNERQKQIKEIARLCRLDMLQFHGSQTPEFCARFNTYRIIKAIRVKDKLDKKDILRYRAFAYLFDTFVAAKAGGTGKTFDWKLLKNIEAAKRPVFLSGGLTEKNVKEAINIVHPDWVDASSSLEIRPGKKDPSKVRDFVKAAKYRCPQDKP